ncbi:MAG TPA: poly-gamma-glutamate biosynthesis protein PgsC/CapC, partial [Planctomycetota bacterium]|nr:poly-gamma-glutamate biosynthesis protein PgsC/CapC [Planctomycetota bacterium]
MKPLDLTMEMSLPVLHIFPEGSLAESVITTVWVGVFVLAMFNLRFGWTLSGLVTPGYLVPLLIVKPLAAGVIFLEGVIAYVIVWLFSERASRLGKWSSFFGRDRFFALVLTSIGVRVVMDGYLLPHIARLSADTFLRDLDFSSNLHSFGLIIVALIANQFWKPGFRRGLLPLVTTVGITYLLVRYPLMYLTNFDLGSLEYLYEEIATSILATPKAYIVLVITAAIASRLNLYYSWDFNGILIPSLLALQWYEPLKILTSFIEAWLIYFVASYCLKLPILKEVTVEGARKILLFFNISFAYKLIVGHACHWLNPALQASDFFGFGYLLPSLIAMKMHDKGIPVRLTRTTLQASIAGTLGASVVGFALTLIPRGTPWPPAYAAGEATLAAQAVSKDVVEQLREDKVLLYGQSAAGGDAPAIPLPSETEAFTRALKSLRQCLLHGRQTDLDEARASLLEAGYDLLELKGGHLYLRERGLRRGWGAYVLDRNRPPGLLIEVPAPLEEWATMEAGAYLSKLFGAASLAVSTKASRHDKKDGMDTSISSRGFFNEFRRVFGVQEVLQVRGYTASGVRALFGIRAGAVEGAMSEIPSSLWVKSKLPSSMDLPALKEILAGIRIEWSSPPIKSAQRAGFSAEFGALFLNREDRKRLLARFLLAGESRTSAASNEGESEPPETSFQEWVLESRSDIAGRGSNLYVAPDLGTLLFLDEEVLKPLLELTRRSQEQTLPPEVIATEVRAIHGAATALNYQVLQFQDKASGERYVILRERPDAFPRRYWGLYVFRLGKSGAHAIEVPHPIYEMNTFEYGVSLFERLSATYLLIAGCHPKCNTDGSSDVVLPRNKRNVFNLVNQVILREARDAPLLVVQVRALGPNRGVVLPDSDALLSLGD